MFKQKSKYNKFSALSSDLDSKPNICVKIMNTKRGLEKKTICTLSLKKVKISEKN